MSRTAYTMSSAAGIRSTSVSCIRRGTSESGSPQNEKSGCVDHRDVAHVVVLDQIGECHTPHSGRRFQPYSGTFSQSINGIARTGRFARVDEMVIFRIADGKIVQAWEVYDESGMWRQLGVTPVAT
jgi:hypothetical protein